MRLIDADALMEEWGKENIEIPLNKSSIVTCALHNVRQLLKLIDDAPTIEPEPKHGRWIEERSGKALDLVRYHCSECGRWQTWSNFPYCPNCGARMDDDWEEPEINPCRGCRDYDGRGGCKSNGGCGRGEVEE